MGSAEEVASLSFCPLDICGSGTAAWFAWRLMEDQTNHYPKGV